MPTGTTHGPVDGKKGAPEKAGVNQRENETHPYQIRGNEEIHLHLWLERAKVAEHASRREVSREVPAEAGGKVVSDLRYCFS